ncbi:peroxiredoxin family protein [Streptomyces sp. NPDC056437]|uniref:peroxiredoxin family protein n=1 Tax=Streptomyces sp. NPDC056437 TaxID=3345816 RepID=UPI0036A7DBBE
MSPAIGDPVETFTLPGGVLVGDAFLRQDFSLSCQRELPLVLAFYPADDSGVSARQLCSYSSGLEEFIDCGAQVWAISPQSVDSHEEFARKHGLRMPLLSDSDRTVARTFGIAAPWIGLRRSVFLIEPDATLGWKHVSLLGTSFQERRTITRHLTELNDAWAA